jgi:hypothetical protein
VASVNEAVEISTLPAWNEVDPRFHGAEYAAQDCNGCRIEAAALES